MGAIIDWICLISFCFLIGEIMLYICKDVMLEYKKSLVNNKRRTVQTNRVSTSYVYENKIAK